MKIIFLGRGGDMDKYKILPMKLLLRQEKYRQQKRLELAVIILGLIVGFGSSLLGF